MTSDQSKVLQGAIAGVSYLAIPLAIGMPMVPFIIIAGLCFAFPRLATFFFIAPICGLTIGGFFWAIAAILIPALNAFPVFLGFCAVAAVGSAIYALSD